MRTGRARTLVPLCAAACVTVPLGGYLLVALDPELLRRGIAATVLVLATMMLRGFRYRGEPRVPTSLALGAVSGALASATSVGGPPVILYLLSGPHPVAVTRANLTLFVMIVSAAALGVLVYRGVLDAPAVVLALVLAPCFLAGIWLGSRVFPHVDEQRFRRFTLVFLIVLAAFLLAT
ncbi:MAG: sulfite exporter TauE/SafE family protein [Halofilum sp. (in: g-proteobacteria)]|nr:sulfite exporter TauE/SafE family protein [Halofilum sp. (in: g-proteobacteria)]